jgi:hypothetical protein
MNVRSLGLHLGAPAAKALGRIAISDGA